MAPLAVQVPDGAVGGWIGFSRADLIARSNKAREGIRALLAGDLADPCVEGLDRIDPVAVIPDYGELAVPRRRGLNRVEGGAPIVTFASVAPVRVAPGASFSLAWESAGADAVQIVRSGEVIVARAAPTGELAMSAGLDDGEIDLAVTPLRGSERGAPYPLTVSTGAPIAITGVEVTQDGRTTRMFAGRALAVVARLDAPRALLDGQLFLDDPTAAPIASAPRRAGVVAFEIPAALVDERVSFTIVVTDPTGARISVRHGPVVLGATARIPVVLARPTVLADDEQRISLEEAEAAVRLAGAPLGLDVSVVDLPWTDDEVAVLVEYPTGDQDPALARVLETLAHRALVTPNFEDAVWLVMLPHGGDKRSVARWTPGYAARALAVAGPGSTARLFAEIFAKPAPVAQRARCLALHGILSRRALDHRGARR